MATHSDLRAAHASLKILARATSFCVAFLLLATWSGSSPAADTPGRVLESPPRALEQIAADVRYLASDELEGRGLGSEGIDKAAEYIAEQFRAAGLNTDVFDGSPMQRFTKGVRGTLGQRNRLALVGPLENEQNGEAATGRVAHRPLKLGEDYTPLSLSNSARLDVPLVFAGYGITARQHGYDDYDGIDVKGKAVIVLRHEPRQDDEDSPFSGTKDSIYAYLQTKAGNAQVHGAAAVLFCTDDLETRRSLGTARREWQAAFEQLSAAHERWEAIAEPTVEQVRRQQAEFKQLLEEARKANDAVHARLDALLGFEVDGPPKASADLPVLHCRRGLIEPIIRAATGKELAAIEQEIDDSLSPRSLELPGWRVRGRVDVERKEVPMQNVVAVLEGEGALAEEAIVIGAHYDHLGRGGFGSLAPGSNEIHNGADDNASGVAVVLAAARQLASLLNGPRRTLVFVAFTGEESGFYGSNHYVQNPVAPIDRTVAMINLDMVGHLRRNRLSVMGVGTSDQFRSVVDAAGDEAGLSLARTPSGASPSDHTPFLKQRVPVLHFFTGMHADYHRPTDDFEKLNLEGMGRVADVVTCVAQQLATIPKRPVFVEVKSPELVASSKRPFFGSMPDFASAAEGFAMAGVVPGGPAARAGLEAGDVVVEFGGVKIASLLDFSNELSKHKAGEKVTTVVRRREETLTAEVELAPPR
ncbi:MAG: M20/M25/M40 family metallo-hydrolase [Planctomycetota bacterium]